MDSCPFTKNIPKPYLRLQLEQSNWAMIKLYELIVNLKPDIGLVILMEGIG